jgi:hypothetical protein
LRLAVFCEAGGDFEAIRGLVDRILREEGPTWAVDLLDAHPDAVRTWMDDGEGRTFFDVHRVYGYARGLRQRLLHGHFDGRPGNADAVMARTAFLVVRDRIKKGDAVDCTIIVHDMDDQGDARREGLQQGREEAQKWASFRIVLGCPDLELEAWGLAGFEPENDAERARLDQERRSLGFCPCNEAHRLRDRDDRTPRSPKRALCALTDHDRPRQERCYAEAPLDRLRVRGAGSGLQVFLDEVSRHIVTLLTRPPAE